MEESWLNFILMGLAVFRLTHLFIYDTITEPLRQLFLKEIKESDENGEVIWHYEPKGKGIIKFGGSLLSCHWCLSVWMGGFIFAGQMIFPIIFSVIIWVFALSAASVLLEEAVIKYF
ncbi:DUF1360 domain-containing protein [Salipaludibacillus sp. CUR1]|uniref:DUF1360 domain-containing protein n=1 Tax=Salipaludibacillus sp. CUR1 TaxID=2820003 RepID=UPI001E28F1F9|nr:DUF1360 domain-containing protein [Salipaludibacillus sp. CUR1]MCE7794845.1 DUF1360 domain-containing protein [Salipaludibacillus sp. CUR1]